MNIAQIMLSRQTGVIHGRFQVLHNDHLAYLLAGKQKCEHLVVGITNPDPSLSAKDEADPNRSASGANPLSYYQRLLLVKCALIDSGLQEPDFSVTPLPINFPRHYSAYVPMQATFFLTIYDEWGKQKLDYLQSMGLKTEVLWERTPQSKGLSGSHIRELMVTGKPWEHLVPKSTAILCKAWDLPKLLQTEKSRDYDSP